jgi:hypothetical protein
VGDELRRDGVLPALIGVFIGAPLVARDFETDPYRFGLTQGVSVRRQLTAKLLVIGTIVLIDSCLLGLLTMWCMAPFHRIALGYDTGISYWQPDYFNITAVTLPAWALPDFCLGVLAGALIKRGEPRTARLARSARVHRQGCRGERLPGRGPGAARQLAR